MCIIAKAYCIKATSNGTCKCFQTTKIGLVSMSKSVKMLRTMYTKYGGIEDIRPIFVSLRGIFERKEKALTEVLDIIEEMDRVEDIISPKNQASHEHIYVDVEEENSESVDSRSVKKHNKNRCVIFIP